MSITILDGGMGQELIARAGRATMLWSVQALLGNPEMVREVHDEYADTFDHVGATVDALETCKDLAPEINAGFARKWVDAGATIIGGCCEVGPAHIALLAQNLSKE